MKLKITNIKHLALMNPEPGQRKLHIELVGVVNQGERNALIEAFQKGMAITTVGPLPMEVVITVETGSEK